MQLTLLYPDFEYPVGQNGIVDNTAIPVQNLAIVAWDGFAWRRIGGVGNFKNNTISVRINSFGFIGIMAAQPLSPEDRRPLEKIISPNGDGVNDSVFFSFGDLAENVKVEIFDINGHRVKTILSVNTLQWDGRDDDGKIVESGVYIYQYEVDSKRVSGVIAVAK
jgi:gliding motility-associated-like protein